MEIITKNDGLPRQLTSAECKLRLDKERKASEEATTKLESDIRAGLWKNYLNDVRLALYLLGCLPYVLSDVIFKSQVRYFGGCLDKAELVCIE